MHQGLFVFAQVMTRVPLTTFRRCVVLVLALANDCTKRYHLHCEFQES